MKRIAVVVGIVAAVLSSAATAESWRGDTVLASSSPSSCPKYELSFTLDFDGGRFSGKAPSGQVFQAMAAPDGSVQATYPSRFGTVTIVGNARTRQLELSAERVPNCRYNLRAGPVVSAGPVVGDWAVGRWSGKVFFPVPEPRVLIVDKTAGSGQYVCRWSDPATVASNFALRCAIEANTIKLETSDRSDVVLERTPQGGLTGRMHMIGAYAGAYTIGLTRE